MFKIILMVFISFTVFFFFPIIVDGENDAFTKSPIYINIQIEAEGDDAQGLINIVDELKKRDIRATISSIVYRGKPIYLCDTACSFDGGLDLKPEEWSEVLRLATLKSREDNTPLTLIFHDWYTGNRDKYGYWESFIEFLDKVEGKAVFIKTHEFVTKNLFQ